MDLTTLRKLVGGLVIVNLIGVYAYCLSVRRVYPPSHPWSAIMFVLLAYLVWTPQSRLTGAALWIGMVLLMASAGLWTFAALIRR